MHMMPFPEDAQDTIEETVVRQLRFRLGDDRSLGYRIVSVREAARLLSQLGTLMRSLERFLSPD